MKAAATKVFHRPPANLNCAQAVIHAYGSVSGDHSHPVAEFADCGGGHAPDAICGALYAACQMAPESGETLTLGFVQRIGSNTCYKTGDGLRTCEVRVETAAEMLEATLMGETSQRLRIAIPMRDAAFSEHFGGATDFRMSDVNRQTKRIFRQTDVQAPEHVSCSFPQWLAGHGVQAVVVGSIGKRAIQMFIAANIQVFIASESESPAGLVAACIEGRLKTAGIENCCSGHGHHHDHGTGGEHGHHSHCH